jgi:hypothetical protein
MRKVKRRVIAPVCFLILGGLFLLSAIYVQNSHKWTPVSFPIDLKPGVTRSPAFRVNLSTDYEIELEVDRSLPLDQLNCLLGIHYDQKVCTKLPSPILLNWVVLSDGTAIKKGASEDIRAGSWGPTVARTIGRMAFEKDRDYFMDVMSLRDVSMLAAATPRISIVVNPAEIETYVIASQLLLYLSIFFGGVGVIWLVVTLQRT